MIIIVSWTITRGTIKFPVL